MGDRMTTIVAVSDLHLDWRTHGVPRFDEIAKALHQAKDEAIKRKADLFVCAGDLGDPDSGSIVYRLLALCIEVMMELHDNDIHVVFVAGNHDGDEGEGILTPLKALAGSLRGFTVAETALWEELESFDLLALPFARYEPEKAVRQFIEWKKRAGREYRTSVVVSHLTSIEGIENGEETSEMPRGGIRSLPLELLAEIKGPVIVISGHWHKRQVFQPRVPGCPPIFVCGSLATLTHGEESNGTPGYLVVEI